MKEKPKHPTYKLRQLAHEVATRSPTTWAKGLLVLLVAELEAHIQSTTKGKANMANANVTLAEALLRRKELQGKVDQLKQIKDKDIFEVKAVRKQVTENVDDIVAKVPKLTASQVTQEYDFYARALRKIDAVIQQANWTTKIDVDNESMRDYEAPPAPAALAAPAAA